MSIIPVRQSDVDVISRHARNDRIEGGIHTYLSKSIGQDATYALAQALYDFHTDAPHETVQGAVRKHCAGKVDDVFDKIEEAILELKIWDDSAAYARRWLRGAMCSSHEGAAHVRLVAVESG